MASNPLPPIAPAFTRVLRRTVVATAITSAVVFALAGYSLISWHFSQRTVEQARLCAILLQSAPDGDMAASAQHLLSRYDRLLAVATLDTSGRPMGVYPESTAIRSAVARTLEHGAAPVRTRVKLGGRNLPVWGIKVPLHYYDAEASRKVVLLFRAEPVLTTWLIIVAVFLLFGMTAAAIAEEGMNRWFAGRVADPLSRLAQPWIGKEPPEEWINYLKSHGCAETRMIAERLRLFGRDVRESRQRIKRIERASKSLIEKYETMFLRKLRRAKHMATTDTLTGMRNRRFLEDKLDPIFEAQRRKGRDLSVVMLDLDNLKHLNDTRGHKAGDELLHFAGALLRGSIRPEDFAIRYGGDEFVLLLPDTGAGQAEVVVKRIVSLFAQYTTSVLNCRKSLTISAGIASLSLDPHCQNAKSLLSSADEALYQAKNAGKNGVALARAA